MDTVNLEVEGGIASVTLNRPGNKNALNPQMRRELVSALDEVRRNETVRAVVLTGAGADFCSGGDLKSMAPEVMTADAARARMQATHEWLEPLLNLDRPVVTAVDGAAYGAGFGLAISGDIVVATARARLCCSFLRAGLVPDCGTMYMLPRLVGLARAKALIFSTDELNGAEARAMGLVHEVCDPQHLLDRARCIAHALASANAVALGMTKRGLNMSLGADLRSMLEYEATAQGIAMTSAGHRDAIGRFLSKQPPTYAGWPQRT